MKGDNLSNRMIKFYNGYSSLTMPRSYGYTMLELVTPRAGTVFTPRTSFEQTW